MPKQHPNLFRWMKKGDFETTVKNLQDQIPALSEDEINVYDSLGDALVAAGQKEKAIKNYEKALSIDPNFASSIVALKKVKGD